MSTGGGGNRGNRGGRGGRRGGTFVPGGSRDGQVPGERGNTYSPNRSGGGLISGGRGVTYAPSRGGGDYSDSGRGLESVDRGREHGNVDRGRGRGRGYGYDRGRGFDRGRGPGRDRGGPRPGQKRRGGLGDDEYTHGDPIFSPPGEQADPNLQITKKENENVRLTNEALTKDLVKYLDLPLRSGYGGGDPEDKTAGIIRFGLRTNYFDVKFDMTLELFRYDVKIEPNSESARPLQNSRKRRQFFKILFEQVPDFQMRGAGIATDYASTLITSGPLFNQILSGKTYYQVYHSEYEQARGENNPPRPKEQNYKITVEPRGMVSLSEIIRYIYSEPTDGSDFTSRQDAIQALNIIMAGTPNKDETVFQSGQNKFYQYPRNENHQSFFEVYNNCDLGGCLIAVRGYFSSIRTSTSRILLNLNAQCSPFYPEMNMRQMMHQFLGDIYSRPNYNELEDFIKKLRVRTEYTKDGNKYITRVMTVKGFSHPWVEDLDGSGKRRFNNDRSIKMKGTKDVDHDWGTANSVRFECDVFKPSRRLTVTDYFREIHQKRLENPEELVLNCGSDDSPSWIPPEFCTVMPGQPYRGTLNNRQTTNMLTIAARPPAENARRITNDGLRVIGIKPRSHNLGSFGITVDPEMLSVHARLLAIPRVFYNNREFLTPISADWNMRHKNFFTRIQITKWSRLILGRAQMSDKSWKDFQQILVDCGMGEVKPSPYDGFRALLPGQDDDDRNDSSIENVMKDISKTDVGIVLVVLPTKSAAIYARVKYWGDVRFGIHTVCVLEEKIVEPKGTYWANIAHKFNLKLKGVNHRLRPDALGILKEGHTMVVGIDVTHPAPKSMENSPSIVGMVASIDNIFAQWPGNLRIQESRQEIQKRRQERKKATGVDDIPKDTEDIVNNIDILMEERLKLFSRLNGRYPRNILIYRDGVSEGQYPAVLGLELKPIQNTCGKLYQVEKLEPPKITIVIVGKRHNTRFFPTNTTHADTKHNCNPQNGTVVDRGITMQKGWDFYLQAHAALKGTARPAHYVVIHDDIKLEVDDLETITHNLSYCFQISTKAVSYCPPAYYADILCERGRCYLMKYVNMRGRPPGTRFNPNAENVPWRTNVHRALQDSMFYI